jgi:hypothetical protein
LVTGWVGSNDERKQSRDDSGTVDYETNCLRIQIFKNDEVRGGITGLRNSRIFTRYGQYLKIVPARLRLCNVKENKQRPDVRRSENLFSWSFQRLRKKQHQRELVLFRGNVFLGFSRPVEI